MAYIEAPRLAIISKLLLVTIIMIREENNRSIGRGTGDARVGEPARDFVLLGSHPRTLLLAAMADGTGAKPNQTVIVSNVSAMIEASLLSELFASCGGVDSIDPLGTPGPANHQRAYLVSFSSVKAVLAALALSGTMLGDRPFRVTEATPAAIAQFKATGALPPPPSVTSAAASAAIAAAAAEAKARAAKAAAAKTAKSSPAGDAPVAAARPGGAQQPRAEPSVAPGGVGLPPFMAAGRPMAPGAVAPPNAMAAAFVAAQHQQIAMVRQRQIRAALAARGVPLPPPLGVPGGPGPARAAPHPNSETFQRVREAQERIAKRLQKKSKRERRGPGQSHHRRRRRSPSTSRSRERSRRRKHRKSRHRRRRRDPSSSDDSGADAPPIGAADTKKKDNTAVDETRAEAQESNQHGASGTPPKGGSADSNHGKGEKNSDAEGRERGRGRKRRRQSPSRSRSRSRDRRSRDRRRRRYYDDGDRRRRSRSRGRRRRRSRSR